MSRFQRNPLRAGEQNVRWQRVLLGRHPAWALARVSALIAGSLLLYGFVVKPVELTGISMEPTCRNGQLSLVNELAYLWQAPSRGDIIAFHTDDSSQILVKRIVGLPGDRLAFHAGAVYINGKSLPEPYLASRGAWEWPEETLGQNTYFVIGDNRAVSEQFRIRNDNILGKLWIRQHRTE